MNVTRQKTAEKKKEGREERKEGGDRVKASGKSGGGRICADQLTLNLQNLISPNRILNEGTRRRGKKGRREHEERGD